MHAAEHDDIHGFRHVERVYNTSVQLGHQLHADMLIVKISSLLHDIGRKKDKKSVSQKNHAKFSAEIAKEYLSSNNFNFSQDIMENIIHCIEAHSFSNDVIPNTLEAKILSDADKLDAIGAIGLYRTIGFTVKNKGGIDQVIEHLENKYK